MANDKMMAQMSGKGGFIAALDQSGGSTPGALRLYGIPDSAYSGDAEMFRLMHQMRVRIMTAPAFTGEKVIWTILFEGTMDGEVRGKPTPEFLWEERGVVPFVKVDKGLEKENDGVQLMRPMPELDALLTRAVKLGVFGTKMRSVINLASKDGIAAIAAQQFEAGARIAQHGLMPILEPEVSIKSPEKPGAEAILLAELTKNLDAAPDGPRVTFKLTLPDVPDLYLPLTKHRRVAHGQRPEQIGTMVSRETLVPDRCDAVDVCLRPGPYFEAGAVSFEVHRQRRPQIGEPRMHFPADRAAAGAGGAFRRQQPCLG